MCPAGSWKNCWHDPSAANGFRSAISASSARVLNSIIRSVFVTSAKISRRDFVKTTAATAGSLTIAGLATAKVLGANDRINMGVIGVGGMGTGHVGSLVKRSDKDNIKVLAVCDVYKRRVTRAQNICKGEGYMDYRKLLD